ncbi:MAG: PIN domain-containing protein [Peptococcaceae bacterium]|nr:PIN domain-containing protein [Peptococcaceae bacterium]
MKSLYILDACSLIAFFNDEHGAGVVSDCLQASEKGLISLFMHKINLLEVYYGFYRESGKALADEMIADVLASDVQIIEHISDAVFLAAGRLKGSYQISLGDAILLGQASVSGTAVLTCDHHEFDPVEQAEAIVFEWIR